MDYELEIASSYIQEHIAEENIEAQSLMGSLHCRHCRAFSTSVIGVMSPVFIRNQLTNGFPITFKKIMCF